MFRSRLLPLTLALSLGSSSCWFAKPKRIVRVYVPPPAKPKPPLPTEVPEVAEPTGIDAGIAAKYEGELMPDLAAPLPVIPPPPPPVTRAKPRPASPPPPAPAPDVPPPPRLGQIFTAEQLREYRRNLDESLDRVRKALIAVVGKNLNRDQSEMVGRIQTFQRQAEQARETDLVTAVNLARRADLLAQDLLKRLP
jgi:hypothetical protein